MADPGFCPGGCANSKNCYYFSKFCQKLHENERIWTPGGRASLAPPLDPSMLNMNYCRFQLGMLAALGTILQAGVGWNVHDLYWMVGLWNRDIYGRYATQTIFTNLLLKLGITLWPSLCYEPTGILGTTELGAQSIVMQTEVVCYMVGILNLQISLLSKLSPKCL